MIFLIIEEIVVLPSKRENTTLMRIERVPARSLQSLDRGTIMHEGRGQHAGIIILKPGAVPPNLAAAEGDGDVTLQFRCYLLHGATGKTSIVRVVLEIFSLPLSLGLLLYFQVQLPKKIYVYLRIFSDCICVHTHTCITASDPDSDTLCLIVQFNCSLRVIIHKYAQYVHSARAPMSYRIARVQCHIE